MAGVDDDDTEMNRFEFPGPSAPFAARADQSLAISKYVSRGKITYKDLIFVTRNIVSVKIKCRVRLQYY